MSRRSKSSLDIPTGKNPLAKHVRQYTIGVARGARFDLFTAWYLAPEQLARHRAHEKRISEPVALEAAGLGSAAAWELEAAGS
ncbi:MAG: hypothetical protein Q8P67_03265, partial [archaeon]|nr:hypothetical protein [archaeon]